MTDNLAADLAAYDTTGDPADLTPESREAAMEGWEGAFRIDNDRMAAWALRKRAQAEGRIEEAREVADAEHARVTSWLEQATATPTRDVAFFDQLLEDYARRQRTEHDRKTLSLPHGTVKTTTVKATGKTRDEARLIAALRSADLDQLVTVTEHAPSVAALVRDGVLEVTDAGAVLTVSGELLPADVVEVTPGHVSVKVATT